MAVKVVEVALSDIDRKPLIELFHHCVVGITDDAGRLRGTGFFAAPGRVATCAHVVQGAVPLGLQWQDRTAVARVVAAAPELRSVTDPGSYPLPDLAVLAVDEALGWGHPCVALSTGQQMLTGGRGSLYLAGYTAEFGPVTTLTGVMTEFEPLTAEDKYALFNLWGELPRGVSGSPLLDLRSGLVMGIVKGIRSHQAGLGGFAVPAAVLAEVFPELVAANREFHDRDDRWRAAAGEKPPLARQALGVLRIEIHGSWSVTDLIKLLGRLEDGYKAAAALESLMGQPSRTAPGHGPQSTSEEPRPASQSADELLQTVTAFQLAGGLRLGSIQYGSPGFLEVIGALNPLKTVKDGITENREINRKRDETRRLDGRGRERQAMDHEEAMARESRRAKQQEQSHTVEVARLQMEAEAARFNAMITLIDRLPTDQRSVAAAQLLQRLIGVTEEIGNDARIDGARMLGSADNIV